MPVERKNFFSETRPFTIQDASIIARTGRIRSAPQREIFRLSQHRLERERQEKEQRQYFLTKEWLQEEVARVRDEPIPEGETPWYYLAGTGFWVKEQVSQLLRNTIDVGRQTYPDVLDLELAKVKVDIEKFEEEYLQQMASLRWNLAWQEHDGQLRVVCPDYGNVLWSSATSKDEREGVVYKTLFGDPEEGTAGIEGWLREAPDNSFAIMVSPKGWSGLRDADGKKIWYPETQVYVIQKISKNNGDQNESVLQGYTFRYDANILQNEELQRRLGLPVVETGDQLERIKNTVRNVAFITPDAAEQADQEGRKAIRSFKDIVDVMEEVAGTNTAYGEGGAIKTFDDIRAFLAHPEKYSKQHPLTGGLIQRFQEYARVRLEQGGVREELERDLQIGLALSLLQLNRMYREEAKGESYVYTGDGLNGRISRESLLRRLVRYVGGGMNYQNEKEDLRRRPGCAGGGEESKTTSMGSSRIGESTNTSEDYAFDHTGKCINCGATDWLGPCDICTECDASMGGKASK